MGNNKKFMLIQTLAENITHSMNYIFELLESNIFQAFLVSQDKYSTENALPSMSLTSIPSTEEQTLPGGRFTNG